MSEVDALISSFNDAAPEAPETKTETKPDIPDTDAAAETPDVADQEAPQDDAEHEDEAEKDRKKAHALQQRLNREVAKRHRAQGEAEAMRERLEQIEQSIRSQQQPSEQRELTQEDVRQQAKQIVEQERTNAQLDDFVEKGRKTLKDFDDKVKEVHSEAPLMDRKGAPTPLMSEIKECDNPYKVLAYLAENPDEAASLADASPSRIARTLARIESELSKPIKKVSSAPAPISPLSSGGRSTVNVDALNPRELLELVRKKP